jgi:hypothetical protein
MTRQPNQIAMQGANGKVKLFLGLLIFFFGFSNVLAQTSWKGTTSTSWSTSSNWTNGVPTSAVDVIIGDASFTGNFQPTLTVQSNCKSLTIGSGTKSSTLVVDKALIIAGSLVIGVNGTISQGNTSINVKGNWTNFGTYAANHTNSTVGMAGTIQSITGTATFRKLTINAGSTTTLNNSIAVNKVFTVAGVLDPQTFQVTLTGSSFAVSPGATIKVKASTFTGNYSVNPTLSAESTVDYASTSISQTIATLTYSTLKISGSTTKTLAANTTLMSSTAAVGNVNVTAGTLDLAGKTLNRGTSVVGGSITVANGAYLKIGGTVSYPTNYASSNLAITSTVEYNGTNQTVSNQPYGNLVLSSSSGSATKTMPGTALTVANDLISTMGSGSVSFTAGANITVNGILTIGSSTTFAGSSYSHTIAGNWVNNGTFTAGTSTVIMSGTNRTISGTSTTVFHNLSITGLGISTSHAALTVAGNLSTSGAGVFTHTSGTLTMSGSSKSISGIDITLNNLTVSGSIGTTSSMIVAGNLTVNGSLNASAGTINMNGTGKTISGSGSIIFYALRIPGTVSTGNTFSIVSDLSGTGKLTATAGTVTFTGTSSYAGTHDLFNVALNGTKLQLGASSTLGIGSTLTLTAGTFDVSSSVPNTVSFNGSGNQNIPATSFDNLITATSGTKTASGALTINNALTISTNTTFTAGSYTHSIKGNWVNNGNFSAGSSTIQLTGDNDTSISGVTTFNVLTLNKSNSSHYVTLNNSISVPTLNMTAGELHTEASTVTITSTRTGNGIILGTITRTHAFSSLEAYAFEGPYNTITLASILGSVTSITVTVHSASVDNFPMDGSINRVYDYSITNTGSYIATMRLHYEDDELNGNSESTMMLWRYTNSWVNSGKSSNSTINNYIENTLITNLNGRWTISDNNVIAVWNGATSTAWETASNWKSGTVPTSDAIVQIGTEAFTHQPSISSSASAKALTFGSVQAATLTLSSAGALTVNGNVRGDWAGNATHVISIGSQALNITGDLVLSNGTPNRMINLNIGSGTATVGGSLTQAGSASIVFSGAGTLNIGESFDYTGGTFTAGTGTVVYNGSMSQTFTSPITINGNLTLSTGGVFNLNAAMTVAGNVTINSGVIVNESSQSLTVGGNWTRTGTYNSSLGTVTFTGTGVQTIGSTTFYNLVINKSGGLISPTGNITINSGLTVTAGTFDLGTYTVNRSVAGGTVTISAGATLKLSGTSNFPGNFNNKTLASTSTVEYNGSIAQNIAAITFGNLVLHGGSAAKVLTGSTTVGGNLTLNTGATLNEGSYTLTLQGDLTNSGSFIPSTSTVVLAGTSKSINGPVNFNNLVITGSYTATTGSNLVIDGNVDLSGSYVNGTNSIRVAGDLLLSGVLSSDGVTTYTGTRQQTLRLTGSITSPSLTHTVIFAGTVAPVLNSSTPPVFANVTISNTGVGGIVTSVDWTVFGTFHVTNGATFNGGSLTHTFYGPQFNNEGSVLSSGTLHFNPIEPYTPSAATVALGSGSAFYSDGVVNFGGTRQIIFTGTPLAFDNVIVSNTHSAGITPIGNWTVNEEFMVTEGAIFNGGGSLSHTFKKDITISGTLNGGATLITLSPVDTIYISGTGAIAFNHLLMTGPVFALDDFGIGGNFTDNGVFHSAGSEISFIGNSNSIISGSVGSVPFETLNINKSSTAKVTLAKDISELTELNILGGTLEDAGHAILEDQTLGGLLAVQTGANLKLGVNNSLPAFSNGYSFHPNSTVEYSGTIQTIAQQTYGNLTLSGVGAKSLMTGTTQVTTLTNSSTFVMPDGSTIELSGNWVNNGTLQANSSSIVKFAGSGIQNISGSVVTNFQNILVTNTASPGVRVESKQNLVNILTLTTNAVFDADGSENSAVFTLLSSGDSPTIDAAIGPLPTGARVEGKVTIQRYMSKEGVNSQLFRYISSPVQNATVADLQGELPVMGNFTGKSVCSACGTAANLYYYNETIITDLNKDKKINADDGYVAFPTTGNGQIFAPGRGYALKVFGNVVGSTLWDLRGNINAGNFSPVSLPMSYTSSGVSASDGWNLVGNPFPSTIDWDSNGWTKANIESAIYVTDNGSGTTRYATWNGFIGVNGGSQYIAMGQAFWVKGSGTGTPVLTANENVKSTGTQTSFFRVGAPQNMVRITLVEGTIKDETVIHFRDGATPGLDATMDARKMLNSTTNLSSIIHDGSFMAINSLPAINCETVVKLSVDYIKPGTHKMTFSDINSFSNGALLTLRDKFTNSTVSVAEGTIYNFSVTSNTASFGSNRFEIIFSTNTPVQDFTPLAQQVCEGSNGMIEITKTQNFVTYVAKINEEIVSDVVTGTGGSISLNLDKGHLTTGTNVITVLATRVGCASLSLNTNVPLLVNEIPQITTQSMRSCVPSSLELQAQGTNAVTYTWYETESSITPLQAMATPSFVTPFLTSSKTYFVSFTNSNGCESPRESIEATIAKVLEVSILAEGNVLSSSYETDNQWSFNGNEIPGANQPVIVAEESGTYTLTVTQEGCSTSADHLFVVAADTNHEVRVNIFPNPVVSTVHIEIQTSVESGQAVILNMNGQLVETVELDGAGGIMSALVNMENYQPGLYVVRIKTSNNSQDIKIIKK